MQVTASTERGPRCSGADTSWSICYVVGQEVSLDLPASRSSLSVVVLGSVSVVAGIGAVVGLAYGGAWASPLIVAIVGAWITYSQQREGREHAEKLAQIGNELKRRSLVYERRLDAYTRAASAMLRIIGAADAHLTVAARNADRRPFKRYTEGFFESASTAIEDFDLLRPSLHLLADEETRRIVDSFRATLSRLDRVHPGLGQVGEEENRKPLERSVIEENLPHLLEARASLNRDYEALLKRAQTYLEQ